MAGALRLVAIPAQGFPSDIDEIARWAREMAQAQGAIYTGGAHGVNYPAVLYVLRPLGALDDEQLRFAIKALSIPFDFAIGVVLYVVARRHGAHGARSLLAAGLYLLNPAVILAGPYWGQLDALGTLPFVVALAAVSARRYVLAGGAATLAALVKPQFGLAALAVAAVVGVEYLHERAWRPALGAATGAGAMALVVAAPLGLSAAVYLELVRTASAPWPYTSLYAFNIWGLAYGFLNSDTPYFATGAALLGVGLAASLVPLWRRRDLATLLAVGTFLAFAFYFLPTRVHERYLFPALATLAPLAAARPRLLWPYVALSGGFTLSLLYALSRNAASTGVIFPDAVERTVFSQVGVVVIGAVLMAAAALSVWRLLTGDMSLRGLGRPTARPLAQRVAPFIAYLGRGLLR